MILGYSSHRPIIFVMHLKEEEEEKYLELLHKEENQILCSPRITLLAYVSKQGSFFHSNYPINILRNVAIRHTTTSHYLLMDMDMMISKNSYETIRQLPPDAVSNGKHAFVLPAFFSQNWELPDLPLEDQMKTFFSILLFIISVLKQVPYTPNELLECRKKSRCLERKPRLFTHV